MVSVRIYLKTMQARAWFPVPYGFFTAQLYDNIEMSGRRIYEWRDRE